MHRQTAVKSNWLQACISMELAVPDLRGARSPSIHPSMSLIPDLAHWAAFIGACTPRLLAAVSIEWPPACRPLAHQPTLKAGGGGCGRPRDLQEALTCGTSLAQLTDRLTGHAMPKTLTRAAAAATSLRLHSLASPPPLARVAAFARARASKLIGSGEVHQQRPPPSPLRHSLSLFILKTDRV